MEISNNKIHQSFGLPEKRYLQKEHFGEMSFADNDEVVLTGNESMQVSFPERKDMEKLFEGDDKLPGDNPCSTGIRSMNDPCFASVKSMNDPCNMGIKSMNDPCNMGIKSMNDPCNMGIRSMNDPCNMGIRSVNDPCHVGIRK